MTHATDGKSRLRLPLVVALSIAGLFLVAALAILFVPTGPSPRMAEGWTAIRDDDLARAHAPLVFCPSRFGLIERVLYRAARHDDGRIRIAYHYVWEKEENPADSFGAAMSRMLYTGGLSLQRLMFGPGDVEVVGIELAPDGAPLSLSYEMAENYSEEAMMVTHRKVEDEPWPPTGATFVVASWNHLFAPANPATAMANSAPHPEYFDDDEWNRYGMTKRPPTFVFRHRAHFAWEVAGVP